MRLAMATCLLLALTALASAAVDVRQSEGELTITSPDYAASLATKGASGALQRLALQPGGPELLRRAEVSLYFKEGKHWVAESWIPATEVSVGREGGATTIAVEVEDFGGFGLRKTLTFSPDSPVIRVAYELRALRPTTPELICPVGLLCSPAVDRLATTGGAVAAPDVAVGDFAIELTAPWYGFAQGDAGVVVAPTSWPDMHRVDYVGKTKEGALSLNCRLYPMRTFAAGDKVTFSYCLVPYRGEIGTAIEAALATPPTAGTETQQAVLAQGLPAAYCPEAPEAPALDGGLTDPCWLEARPLGPFATLEGGGPPDAQTQVHVARDATALFFAVRCREPHLGDVRADCRPGSDRVWQDDCIELFIQPRQSGADYTHLIINAAGVRQDNLAGERATAHAWSAAAGRDDDAWTLEVRVPFADLDVAPPGPGETWRLNVCRSRLPRQELSAWSPTLRSSDFHVPDRFGLLVFGDPLVRITHIVPGLDGKGPDRSLLVALQNDGPEPARVIGSATITPGGGARQSLPMAVTVPAGADAPLSVSYATEAVGSYEMRVQLFVQPADEPLLDCTLTAEVRSQGLCSALYPPEADQNRLCLAKGTVQHLFFVPANHGQTPCETFDFVLEVPEGVEITQATGEAIPYYHRPTLTSRTPFTRGDAPMVRWVWTSDRSLGPGRIEQTRFFSAWCGALSAGATVAEGEYPMVFYLQSGEQKEEPHEGKLVVLPRPEGRQPRHIVIGMSNWTISPTPEFWQSLLETYRLCGINAVDCHLMADGDGWAGAAKAAGMRRTVGLWWFWWNDSYLKDHPDHAAVAFDGKPDAQTVCPEVMADASGRAIEGVMSGLVAAVKAGHIEGSWWDLEGPACFQLCFCPRCLTRFREEAQIPAEEELSPARIQAKYADRWVAFACGQSARIARRMRQYAHEAGADWKLLLYSGTQSEHTRRAYRVDWNTLTPEIDVATPSFYSFSASALATTFTRGVTDCARAIRAAKDVPVWTTLTTGYDRGEQMVTDGRVTRMQLIKSVAFGADGTLQWWWGPTDGRHYRAYGEATSIIAELEPFFVEGSMVEDLWPEPAAAPMSRVAWRLGEGLLVMVFNDGTAAPIEVTAPVPPGLRLLRADPRTAPALNGGALRAAVPALDYTWAVLGPAPHSGPQ